ncbi:MAG: Asp-tRNA(Asn)/Glu-tRNA(Gln) amidotransferase subunit GatC [Planctomycetaceae bacterium]|nr:Asp-tRNA(Asn)/Glu-tRNA(Gln) amidotransferase subunit GatC [Planctomycetaceae bacterium]
MSKNVDEALVRHIGVLARVELTDPEVESHAAQLGAILEYFDKLNELPTDGVEPMVHAMELSNVLADDTPEPSLTSEQALQNAPARDGDYFKVPKVIGESQ